MKTDQELMQQALDDLMSCSGAPHWPVFQPTITALRERLAQLEQEPVAWQGVLDKTDLYYRKPVQGDVRPLYTTPPAAQRQLENEGCACRWDHEDNRVVTCERHQGWLEVIAEWADRAREAEANLKAEAQRQPQGWIAVDERMPEPGAYVLAVFRYTTGKQRVIRAMHAPRHTLSEDDYGEFVTEGADYDEATDTTYWPEGWYECNENEETHWQVHEEVTHWMPLPAAPSVGEKPDAA